MFNTPEELAAYQRGVEEGRGGGMGIILVLTLLVGIALGFLIASYFR